MVSYFRSGRSRLGARGIYLPQPLPGCSSRGVGKVEPGPELVFGIPATLCYAKHEFKIIPTPAQLSAYAKHEICTAYYVWMGQKRTTTGYHRRSTSWPDERNCACQRCWRLICEVCAMLTEYLELRSGCDTFKPFSQLVISSARFWASYASHRAWVFSSFNDYFKKLIR